MQEDFAATGELLAGCIVEGSMQEDRAATGELLAGCIRAMMIHEWRCDPVCSLSASGKVLSGSQESECWRRMWLGLRKRLNPDAALEKDSNGAIEVSIVDDLTLVLHHQDAVPVCTWMINTAPQYRVRLSVVK